MGSDTHPVHHSDRAQGWKIRRSTLGAAMIAHERASQIDKGWTIEHDVETHSALRLAQVGAYVALGHPSCWIPMWGRALVEKLRSSRLRAYVVAGAMTAAAIDRYLADLTEEEAELAVCAALGGEQLEPGERP